MIDGEKKKKGPWEWVGRCLGGGGGSLIHINGGKKGAEKDLAY